MFLAMDNRLPVDKAIRLLQLRGRAVLAKALRHCWLEEDIHDTRVHGEVFSTIRIHAPLEQYEYLRSLDDPLADQLLEVFKELYSSQDVVVLNVKYEIEINEESDQQLIATIEKQKGLMIAVATGERRIQDVNEEYKKRRDEISKALQGKGIKDPNRFGDLWSWYNRWKSGDLPSYQSRRHFVSDLYAQTIRQLESRNPSTPGMFEEPTGWARLDRCVTRIREQLEQATNEEEFQLVGTLCREALISLAQAVFDANRHPSADGVEISPTDFKRMMEAYFTTELGGESMKHARQHARAAFDLANELQHKRTATFRHAALCAEATVAVANLVAIVSGRRDP
jgi:hypothetical protein